MAEIKEVFGIKEVEQRGEKKSYWTRIGVAFVNRDGSINVKLDYVPISNEIVLQVKDKKEKEDKGYDEGDEFQG